MINIMACFYSKRGPGINKLTRQFQGFYITHELNKPMMMAKGFSSDNSTALAL